MSTMSADKEMTERKTSTSSDLASPVTEPVTTEELPAKEVDTAPKEEPEYEWLTGMKLWAVMGPLILVFFLILLDTTIISTAIPKITNHFNSLKDIGWYTASYQLASAVLQPLAGKLYVSFSNKWTFISFFAVFELGSLLCGVANTSKMLIVGRAIAGAGTAGLQNGAFTIISASVPLHKRPALIGICQALAQLGIVFGPLIGGALTQYTTWRWCFYINLPIGAVAAVFLVFDKIPDAHKKPPAMEVVRDLHHKLDLIGFALFAPAVIMLLLAMLWGGNDYAWDSATVIGLFCGFGGLFVIWGVWNWYKKDDALIPISMITKTTVWSGCVVVGCLMAALYIAAYYLPIYFQSVYGASPTMSGVYLLPNIVAALLAAVIAGKLVGMLGYYTPFSILAAVLMSIGLGLCGMLGVHSSTGNWIGFQILFGAGRGMGMQMPIVAVQNRLPPTMAPLAIALCMFSGMLFGALFLSASATIFTNSLATLIPKYSPGADVHAIVTAGATGFREVVPVSQLPGILVAYAKSVNRVFFLCAALAAICLPFSFGLGWTNIKEKKAVPQAKAQEAKDEKERETSDSAV